MWGTSKSLHSVLLLMALLLKFLILNDRTIVVLDGITFFYILALLKTWYKYIYFLFNYYCLLFYYCLWNYAVDFKHRVKIVLQTLKFMFSFNDFLRRNMCIKFLQVLTKHIAHIYILMYKMYCMTIVLYWAECWRMMEKYY